MSGELPSGWTHFSLKNLGGLSGGKTPSKANPDFWSSPDVPWVSPKDMKKDRLNDSEDKISQAAMDEARMMVYPTGSVLMVTRSGILQHTFPVALAGADLTVNQDIKVLRPTEGISPKFSFFMLKSFGREILSACAKDGTTVQSIDSEKLEAFQFPLPPLAEQTRIAQKLDDLLAQVDTLKARIDAVPALLKRFRQSVLAAAVSGRLTEEWRILSSTLSPISLDDVRKAWSDAYLSRGKKWKAVDLLPGNLGYPLPDSWVETKLGEVFDVYVGATPSRENTEFWGGNIPWVSSSEVAFCRIKSTKESITEAGYKSASTTIQPTGTVMLAMIGQGKTRGQPAILDIEACHNQNTAAIRINPNYCIPEYLYYYLYERYEENRRVGSGNNQQALNKKTVQSLPFPLPPLAEQTEIVRCVEQLFAFADQLEAKIQTAQARVNHLTQSILAKAFRGELVPQDPNDEPASVLLERIQAQRAAAPKAKRRHQLLNKPTNMRPDV